MRDALLNAGKVILDEEEKTTKHDWIKPEILKYDIKITKEKWIEGDRQKRDEQ